MAVSMLLVVPFLMPWCLTLEQRHVTAQEADPAATDLALLLYKDYVRRWLLRTHGYECQEDNGVFMLAFSSALPAVQFCLLVCPAGPPEPLPENRAQSRGVVQGACSWSQSLEAQSGSHECCQQCLPCMTAFVSCQRCASKICV